MTHAHSHGTIYPRIGHGTTEKLAYSTDYTLHKLYNGTLCAYNIAHIQVFHVSQSKSYSLCHTIAWWREHKESTKGLCSTEYLPEHARRYFAALKLTLKSTSMH